MRFLSTTLASLPGRLRRVKHPAVARISSEERPDGRKLLLDMPAEKVIRLFEDNTPTRS